MTDGWTISRVGQDHEDGEFLAVLIRDGEFYNGRGMTIGDAIYAAKQSEPYVPVYESHNSLADGKPALDEILAIVMESEPALEPMFKFRKL